MGFGEPLYWKKIRKSDQLFQQKLKSTAKTILICSLLGLLSSCSSASTPDSPTPLPIESPPANSFLITIKTPPYTLEKDADGFDRIEVEDYSSTGIAGEFMLPTKVIGILVPPDVVLESISIQVEGYQAEPLEGVFKFKVAEAPRPSGGDDSGTEEGQITGLDIIEQLPTGQMRKWIFTQVRYSPFLYDDSSGKLQVVNEVQLRVGYELSGEEVDQALLKDTAMDEQAEETFPNFTEAKEWYQPE